MVQTALRRCSYGTVREFCVIRVVYVLFQECSKKQKNDDTQSTSVDALSSNGDFEEVMFLLKIVRYWLLLCTPKEVVSRELLSTKYNTN